MYVPVTEYCTINYVAYKQGGTKIIPYHEDEVKNGQRAVMLHPQLGRKKANQGGYVIQSAQRGITLQTQLSIIHRNKSYNYGLHKRQVTLHAQPSRKKSYTALQGRTSYSFFVVGCGSLRVNR